LPPPSDAADLRNKLAALEIQEAGINAKLEKLRMQVAWQRKNLPALSQEAVELTNLRRTVEVNRNLVSILTDKLTTARLHAFGPERDVRIVVPATLPVKPTDSQAAKFGFLVVVLSAGLAFGVSYGLEFLRTPVETESDVFKATGLTVLGSVGVMQRPLTLAKRSLRESPILLSVQPHGASNQQGQSIHIDLYRAIRANIETARLKAPFRSILVTSPGPHEGKSTTILNLAHVFQEFGRRVLVVEADLRRPSLCSPLALTNKPGIVDFLNGTAKFEQVCRRLPSGVTLIPGQVTRGDAASLLASPRFKELLHVATAEYDLVLIDSAPILAVPDNLLLAHVVDRALLIAKATQTSTRELRKAQSALERAGGRLLGVVLNHANARDVPYYHRRYRKYYAPSNGKRPEDTPRKPSVPSLQGEEKKTPHGVVTRSGQQDKASS